MFIVEPEGLVSRLPERKREAFHEEAAVEHATQAVVLGALFDFDWTIKSAVKMKSC